MRPRRRGRSARLAARGDQLRGRRVGALVGHQARFHGPLSRTAPRRSGRPPSSPAGRQPAPPVAAAKAASISFSDRSTCSSSAAGARPTTALSCSLPSSGLLKVSRQHLSHGRVRSARR